jgi:hypothetical protein
MPRHTRTLIAALLLVLPAGYVADQFRIRAQDHYRVTQKYEALYYLPPADYLRLAALSHREALADFIWLKAVIYFGQELVHRGSVENLYRYTDAMLALDPYFKRVYHWVAGCALYRTGEIGESDARKAIAYLERGMRLFPDDGELAWDLGATYMYELVPMVSSPAEKAKARERGLGYLELASLRGAGPAWLGLQAAAQLSKLGKTENAIRHLQDIHAITDDPQLKAQIEQRIAQLRSAAYAEALRRATEELEAARRRDFPYADTTLYLLLGRRPPFDGTALRLRNFDPVHTQASERAASDAHAD